MEGFPPALVENQATDIRGCYKL